MELEECGTSERVKIRGTSKAESVLRITEDGLYTGLQNDYRGIGGVHNVETFENARKEKS